MFKLTQNSLAYLWLDIFLHTFFLFNSLLWFYLEKHSYLGFTKERWFSGWIAFPQIASGCLSVITWIIKVFCTLASCDLIWEVTTVKQIQPALLPWCVASISYFHRLSTGTLIKCSYSSWLWRARWCLFFPSGWGEQERERERGVCLRQIWWYL